MGYFIDPDGKTVHDWPWPGKPLIATNGHRFEHGTPETEARMFAVHPDKNKFIRMIEGIYWYKNICMGPVKDGTAFTIKNGVAISFDAPPASHLSTMSSLDLPIRGEWYLCGHCGKPCQDFNIHWNDTFKVYCCESCNVC